MPSVTLSSDRAPGLPEELTIRSAPDYTGGEANVYLSDDFAVKIYKRVAADTEKRLRKVISLGRGLGDDERVLAWPLAVVEAVDGQARLGCVTRRVPSPPYTPLLQLTYGPVDALKQFRAGRSWVEFVKIARSAAGAIRAVHDRGIVPSDISFNNVLADPVSGNAVLIDLDSLVVAGFVEPTVGGTPRFRAPELVMGTGSLSERSDRYSAAVLILWTLLFRNVMQPPETACYALEPEEDERLAWGEMAVFSEHPSDRRHAFPRIGYPLYRGGALSYRCLTPRLQQLTEQALIEGLHTPEKRPMVRYWERALADAYDVLVVCPACRQSCMYPFWVQPAQRRQCPFCGISAWSPRPLVLELLEPGDRMGIMSPVRPVVLQPGAPLFADVLAVGARPPFSRRGTPVVGRVEWDPASREYRAVNRSDTSWRTVIGGTAVAQPGEALALRRETVVQFGEGKRLARVVE